jgi:putative phage-type endonuclease
MEVFYMPLNETSHLTRRIKAISLRNGLSFSKYKRKVFSLMDTDLAKVWARRRRIYRVLQKYGKADQRSAAWLTKRSEMITASEVTKAFANATPSAKRELLLSKLDVGTKGSGGGFTSGACAWGTQFEPLAKKIYGDILGGADIVDTSCVVHPTYPFIGASPDGIVMTKNPTDPHWGKLVEFKCPISRQFTQDTPIPDAYYHQMQLQMECTGIDECDYVEMQFKTCNQTLWKQSGSPYKGVFVIYDDGRIDYKDDDVDHVAWKQTIQGDEHRVVYWTLQNIRIQNVNRDFNWMSDHFGELQTFWNMVLECRKDPSKMDQYVPHKDPRDVLSLDPLEETPNPVPASGSSSGHTMKLRLDE